MTGFISGTLSLWVLGAAFFALVAGMTKYHPTRLEFGSTSFLLGLALSGYLLFILNIFGVSFDIMNIRIITVISAVVLSVLFLSKSAWHFDRSGNSG